jgi:ADP-heptose:LPS heptosyltransferase
MVTGKNLIDWADRNKIKEAQRHGLEHKIWLTTQEQIIINDISSGKYVAIHPFAGLPHRGCLPHPYDGKYKCYPDYKYAESANLLAEAGYKVVFVGKTSYDGVEELRGFEEKLDFKVPMHSNVISLVNKASLRLNTELVRRANGFMGSHSSMLSAAWTNEVPSVFFYPGWDEHGNRRSVREHGGTTGTWALEREYHNYFEHTGPGFLRMNPREPVDLLLSHMR